MSIDTEEELEALREAGRAVREVLDALEEAVHPGVTTGELDLLAGEVLKKCRARSAPRLVYEFPGNTCISVNEEVVHGIPGTRVLEPGDVVKLDVVAEKGGFMCDAARTVVLDPVSPDRKALCEGARAALKAVLPVAKAGNLICDLGKVIESTVKRYGLSVVPELCGHGVGRTIHEEPMIPNFYDPRLTRPLTEGLVVAIEPIVTLGTGAIRTLEDGWTISTRDGALAAHAEHTVMITKEDPVVLAG